MGKKIPDNKSKILSVLVVDDDHDVLESLRQILELSGYEVHTAKHGREAIRLLVDISPPGLILLDLTMPVMNGQEFLQFIQENRTFNRIPVVVISAFIQYQNQDQNESWTATEVMPKPINFHSLLKLVEKYCGKV